MMLTKRLSFQTPPLALHHPLTKKIHRNKSKKSVPSPSPPFLPQHHNPPTHTSATFPMNITKEFFFSSLPFHRLALSFPAHSSAGRELLVLCSRSSPGGGRRSPSLARLGFFWPLVCLCYCLVYFLSVCS